MTDHSLHSFAARGALCALVLLAVACGGGGSEHDKLVESFEAALKGADLRDVKRDGDSITFQMADGKRKVEVTAAKLRDGEGACDRVGYLETTWFKESGGSWKKVGGGELPSTLMAASIGVGTNRCCWSSSNEKCQWK